MITKTVLFVTKQLVIINYNKTESLISNPSLRVQAFMRINNLLLKLGSIQTMTMGAYHFYIPIQYKWQSFIEEDNATINWALFALNNYFSFLLLLLGIFLWVLLKRKPREDSVIFKLALLLFIFWVFSFVYQLIYPMTLPRHLSWIAQILTFVALLNAIIFAIPLKKYLRK